MRDLGYLGIRILDGGVFVVLFALVGTVLKPKRLAGLFSAAPSVALANLLVEIMEKGDHPAAKECQAMILGAVALAAFCLVARFVIRPLGALRGSAVAVLAWLAVAVG